MKPYKILIIEDDPVIQGEMETLLRGNGYTAVSVKDFSRVTDTFKAEEPHLVLLDIKLPNESGFSICSKIRSISNVPIIFVTSCNTDMDELNSIMLGGDAFITKPYNTAILLAKIAALLRRVYASEQSEILTWNDATLHLESSMIEYKGQKAELTKNELKILYYLFKSAGKICSRNDMVDFLWDNQTSVYKGYKQDKIEMRGDRAEMSDFPLYLNTVAGGLDRRDQTIGGFSFVVKIYAVPVVEIIG